VGDVDLAAGEDDGEGVEVQMPACGGGVVVDGAGDRVREVEHHFRSSAGSVSASHTRSIGCGIRRAKRTWKEPSDRFSVIDCFVNASGPSMIGSRGRSVCWTEGA
jgi:hypothetical protein